MNFASMMLEHHCAEAKQWENNFVWCGVIVDRYRICRSCVMRKSKHQNKLHWGELRKIEQNMLQRKSEQNTEENSKYS
jgi:hypothetical protein